MNHRQQKFYQVQKRLNNVLLYSHDEHEKHLAGRALQRLIFKS